MFRTILPTASLNNNSLSLILTTPTTSSIHFSETITPTPAKPRSQPLQNNLYRAPATPRVLALPPSQRVSCKQQTSKRLLQAISTISPLRLRSVPTFTLPTLKVTPLLLRLSIPICALNPCSQDSRGPGYAPLLCPCSPDSTGPGSAPVLCP